MKGGLLPDNCWRCCNLRHGVNSNTHSSVRYRSRWIIGDEFNFAFDFDRYVEGKLRKTHGTTAVRANHGSEQLQYEIGKSVYHARLLVEPRS